VSVCFCPQFYSRLAVCQAGSPRGYSRLPHVQHFGVNTVSTASGITSFQMSRSCWTGANSQRSQRTLRLALSPGPISEPPAGHGCGASPSLGRQKWLPRSANCHLNNASTSPTSFWAKQSISFLRRQRPYRSLPRQRHHSWPDTAASMSHRFDVSDGRQSPPHELLSRLSRTSGGSCLFRRGPTHHSESQQIGIRA